MPGPVPRDPVLSPEKREQVDRLLVCGEEKPDGTRVFPSVREIAARFNVSTGVVANMCVKYACVRRKMTFQVCGRYSVPPFGVRPDEREEWIEGQCKVTVPEERMVEPPPAPQQEPERVDPFLPDIDPNAEPYDREPPERPRRRGPKHPPAVRPPVHPRRAEAPVIPWEEIDRLLVMGELVENEDGTTGTYYPTQLELAARFGIHQTAISKYWLSHNCADRREKAKTRLAIRVEEKIIERRAENLAVSKDEVVELLDGYIREFRDNLKDRKMRFDSVVDLNTVVRLKEFVMGGADSRQEIQGALTLQAIQDRHSQFREVTAYAEDIPDVETEASDVTALGTLTSTDHQSITVDPVSGDQTPEKRDHIETLATAPAPCTAPAPSGGLPPQPPPSDPPNLEVAPCCPVAAPVDALPAPDAPQVGPDGDGLTGAPTAQ